MVDKNHLVTECFHCKGKEFDTITVASAKWSVCKGCGAFNRSLTKTRPMVGKGTPMTEMEKYHLGLRDSQPRQRRFS